MIRYPKGKERLNANNTRNERPISEPRRSDLEICKGRRRSPTVSKEGRKGPRINISYIRYDSHLMEGITSSGFILRPTFCRHYWTPSIPNSSDGINPQSILQPCHVFSQCELVNEVQQNSTNTPSKSRQALHQKTTFFNFQSPPTFHTTSYNQNNTPSIYTSMR